MKKIIILFAVALISSQSVSAQAIIGWMIVIRMVSGVVIHPVSLAVYDQPGGRKLAYERRRLLPDSDPIGMLASKICVNVSKGKLP